MCVCVRPFACTECTCKWHARVQLQSFLENKITELRQVLAVFMDSTGSFTWER